MNNTFNFGRFLRLFNKHTREQYRTYLMSIAVLIGIFIVIMGALAYSNDGFLNLKAQAAYFDFFLLAAGTIFTSTVFAELGDEKKTIPALTLPVSHFERFLVGWIYSFIFFQLVFLTSFYSVAALVAGIGENNPLVHNHLLKLDPKDPMIYVAYTGFVLLHGATLFGAITFKKLHFIKTAFALFVFLIVLLMINSSMIHMIFGENAHAGVPFAKIFLREGNINSQIKAGDTGNMITKIMVISTVILLWTSAYFKLKEKQV